MDNLFFTTHKTLSVSLGQPIKISYQHATKTIIILNSQYKLFFIQYTPDNGQATIRNQTESITQLSGQNILLLEYLVDAQSALVLTSNGAIMTINQAGIVDIKAQNDDGIAGGSLSPEQQYIYIVTANNTLIQLNIEFDLVKQIQLDDHQSQKVDSYDPRFSWKPDGSFFAINILTDKGRKCHTRDNMLGIFRSPSKSDVQPEGLVQSVSQKSRLNMSSLVAWQPSGGIIAGSDYINKQGKKINRVIFWEKNGLRHLEFELPALITDVLNLTWSPDSQILAVQVLNITSQRWLYLYYRSNYHWYLKHPVRLQNQLVQYILTKKKHNQLIILDKDQIQILQYVLQPPQPNWLTQTNEQKNPTMLQTNIDGHLLKITDFSMGLIPPPICHFSADFDDNLCGVAVQGDIILVSTTNGIWVARWKQGSLIQKKKVINDQFKNLLLVPVNFRLLSVQPTIKFTHNNQIYQINPTSLQITKTDLIPSPQIYTYTVPSIIETKSQNQPKQLQQNEQKLQQKTITVQLNQQTLTINNIIYAEHCTSYIFYHQFLIFTVASSNMYDKMFILDFELDQLNNIKDSIKLRLEEMESKKLLNYRAIERGSKIIGASRNRIVFQLPRGNLQGIYPKVITIKYVKKCLQHKKFKQAFQTIRTHKLDLNLLYDINPQNFTNHAQQILLNIKRTDYLNLFVSQLRDNISFELPYCKTQQQRDQIQSYIQINLQGKKIKQVCEIVSKTLRKCDKNKFILSIFTSQIKMGKLNQVLFQIKDMKAADVEVIVPPHLQQNGNKNKKQLTSQQILQYVCWLVDANAIYQASLLTYDLELASITARCTQMDPKQYIPYLEQLKTISDPIQLRKRICLDLKKYENAVQQLSKGNQEQIKLSIQLVKKHKLFKCGLKSYNNRPQQLKLIKLIVIDELLSNGENNQAYKLCLSIQAYQKALEIAIKITDGSKIKEVLENYRDKTRQERQEMARKIIKDIGQDGFKNKSDLAKLKAYVGSYNEATIYYIRSGNYQKAYKNYLKSNRDAQITKQFNNGMLLQFSLQKNLLLKQKSQFIEKLARLHKVHKNRAIQGPILNVRNLQNDDMYSQVSMSSKAASQYTISTTTGLRKKRDKKRSILSRNVKEGSPLQQQYLVAFLTDLLNKAQPNIKQTKLLIQHLIYVNLIAEAEFLRNTCKQYAQVASKCNPKFYAQVKFQADHPEYLQLLQVYENKGMLLAEKDKGKQRRDRFSIDSFNYMF